MSEETKRGFQTVLTNMDEIDCLTGMRTVLDYYFSNSELRIKMIRALMNIEKVKAMKGDKHEG